MIGSSGTRWRIGTSSLTPDRGGATVAETGQASVPRWGRIAPLHREMGYVGGTLFLTGAVLVLVDLLFPPHDYVSRGGVVVVAVAATLAGLFYLWSADHLPMPIWGYAIGTAAGAVMVTVLVLSGGQSRTATFGVLYVFVSTYGFYYYGNAIAWGLVALNGIGFAVALVVHDVEGAVAQWVMVVGTSAMAGGLLGSLSQRVRSLLRAEQENVRRLNQADAWKTTFMRAVAHDLRSPLSSMQGLLMTLREHGDALSPQQQADLLDRSVEASERLDRLLGDLLDMQRIEAGALEPDLAPARLDELVRESLGTIDLGGRDVHLELEPVTAAVEAPKVDRIVTNLVRNAISHTPADVTVWIRLRHREDMAELVVEDDGPGLDDQVPPDLFEAFTRHGDGDGRGVGLGLHLVRRFTELHAGEVTASDRPGGGARFVVRLPVRADGEGGPDTH